MKDGEILVVERCVEGIWRFRFWYYTEEDAKTDCDCFNAASLNEYRYVKYVRQEAPEIKVK